MFDPMGLIYSLSFCHPDIHGTQLTFWRRIPTRVTMEQSFGTQEHPSWLNQCSKPSQNRITVVVPICSGSSVISREKPALPKRLERCMHSSGVDMTNMDLCAINYEPDNVLASKSGLSFPCLELSSSLLFFGNVFWLGKFRSILSKKKSWYWKNSERLIFWVRWKWNSVKCRNGAKEWILALYLTGSHVGTTLILGWDGKLLVHRANLPEEHEGVPNWISSNSYSLTTHMEWFWLCDPFPQVSNLFSKPVLQCFSKESYLCLLWN